MGKPNPTSKRRFLRLSLRSFLALFTVLCLLLGWKTNPALRQREAVEAIRKVGGALAYDYEDYRQNRSRSKPVGKPPAPEWLQDLLGVDFFADVIQVDCHGTRIIDIDVLAKLPQLGQLNLNTTKVHDLSPLANLTNLHTLECRETRVADISALSELVELQFLQLRGTQISDLTPLMKLTNLEQLYLHGTPVRDASPLANLQNLKFLGMRGTDVSDITPFSNLKKLKWLDVRDTLISDEDVQALQRTLPDCNIEFSNPNGN